MRRPICDCSSSRGSHAVASWVIASGLLFGLLVANPLLARADAAACVEAHADAQRSRLRGELLHARDRLIACAQAQLPGVDLERLRELRASTRRAAAHACLVRARASTTRRTSAAGAECSSPSRSAQQAARCASAKASAAVGRGRRAAPRTARNHRSATPATNGSTPALHAPTAPTADAAVRAAAASSALPAAWPAATARAGYARAASARWMAAPRSAARCARASAAAASMVAAPEAFAPATAAPRALTWPATA